MNSVITSEWMHFKIIEYHLLIWQFQCNQFVRDIAAFETNWDHTFSQLNFKNDLLWSNFKSYFLIWFSDIALLYIPGSPVFPHSRQLQSSPLRGLCHSSLCCHTHWCLKFKTVTAMRTGHTLTLSRRTRWVYSSSNMHYRF